MLKVNRNRFEDGLKKQILELKILKKKKYSEVITKTIPPIKLSKKACNIHFTCYRIRCQRLCHDS